MVDSDNRRVQPPPQDKQDNDEIENLFDSMVIHDIDLSPSSDDDLSPADEDLFKTPPKLKDCPICFLLLPTLESGGIYKSCCGKTICNGCFMANAKINLKKQLCAFCRTPPPRSDKEAMHREKKRAEAGDVMAIYNIGCHYGNGEYGYSQDHTKALEFWHRAAELGFAKAYENIGATYYFGEGVEEYEKKAIYYWELAAMGGDAYARHNLGRKEEQGEGNLDKALRHYLISLRGGYASALKDIKNLFTDGYATKDDYTKALRAYQEYLEEIKSDERDRAAAYNDRYRYY